MKKLQDRISWRWNQNTESSKPYVVERFYDRREKPKGESFYVSLIGRFADPVTAREAMLRAMKRHNARPLYEPELPS